MKRRSGENQWRRTFQEGGLEGPGGWEQGPVQTQGLQDSCSAGCGRKKGWGATLRERGAQVSAFHAELESTMKAEQTATEGSEAGTRWDKGFASVPFLGLSIAPRALPHLSDREGSIPTMRENQAAAPSLLMRDSCSCLWLHALCCQVENTNVVTLPLWILLAGRNCSFEIQFLLFQLNTLHLHLEWIMVLLPKGRKTGNPGGYLFCSLPTLHVQENTKEAQETKWYVHTLANTKKMQAPAKIDLLFWTRAKRILPSEKF